MAESESKGSFWTTLPGILAGIAAVIAAVGTTAGGLAALGVFDPASDSPTPTASATAERTPSPPTSLVSCAGGLETGIWGEMNSSQPTYVAPRDLCVTAFTLYENTAGTGLATVEVDGATVYSIDLDNFDAIGEEGAGSGERYHRIGRAIGVASGQTLALDFSECANCGGLVVLFEGAPR